MSFHEMIMSYGWVYICYDALGGGFSIWSSTDIRMSICFFSSVLPYGHRSNEYYFILFYICFSVPCSDRWWRVIFLGKRSGVFPWLRDRFLAMGGV